MKNKILLALNKATGEDHIHLETPDNVGRGDFATNIAMIVAKKNGLKPIEYAN